MKLLPSPDRAWRIAAAVLSGALLPLVSPPNGIAALHWFAFIPFLVALDPRDRRLNFRLGYLSGFVGVFLLFFWLADTILIFSNLPMVAAVAIVVLFAAVWGLPYGLLAMLVHPLRRRFGARWVFLFPACWVASEYLQPALFPYFQGVGQYRTPYTWQLASVFGAMGVTYLVLLTNCAMASLWMDKREGVRPRWIPAALTAALFVANLGFGYWRYHAVEDALATAPIKRVSLLQQEVTMQQRLRDSRQTTLNSWLSLTAEVVREKPDLVIWPEGAVPGNPHEGKLEEILGGLAERGGFWFLVGGGTGEADRFDVTRRVHYNSAYLFSPDGDVEGRYDKMVPLPFGEYLPWPFGFLRDYIEGPGNFRKGTTPFLFKAGDVTFTTPICYEAILERQMRELMGADLFVNITNDGWFGDTAAPHQHAMLSAVQSMQFGRPMVRVAYTGVSMIVEPHGKILAETAPYTDSATVAPVRLHTFETPYRTWGGWFPLVTSLVAAVAGAIAVRSERRAAVGGTEAA